MKKMLVAAIFAAFGASAQAATLDFIGDANASERGVASGFTYNNAFTDGVTLTLESNYNPYFDDSNAGLGVCKVLNGSAQCNPTNDDNVTVGESLTVKLDGTYKLSNLLFTGEGHSVAAGIVPLATTETLLFGTNGGALAQWTFAALSSATFNKVKSFSFHFDDGNATAEQFYLANAVVSPVPVPASLPLLLAGFGGLAALRRKRRKAA